MHLKTWAAALVLAASWPAPASADLTVRYQSTHSELVLFKQPQEAPFAQVRFALYLSGPRVRTEMVDALGRSWWFLTDRSTGEAYGLDPVERVYWREQGAWRCTNLAGQVAAAIRNLMQRAQVHDLVVSPRAGGSVDGLATQGAAVRFMGRVLGSPQPVATELDVFFPESEAAAFGKSSPGDLYCSERPSPAAWAGSLEKYVGLDAPTAAYLGELMTIPLRVEIRANLGIGTAALTLAVAETSQDKLDDGIFELPEGFTERKR